MMEFLFNLVINPLCLFFEFVFDNIYDFSDNIIFSIFFLSFVVSIFSLPLYLRAEKIQEEERKVQEKLFKKANSIKKNFKGDERFFLLQTYYKQNNYNPLMALRGLFGLLLQIPIFLAAYAFFANLQILNGMSAFIILDLSNPDTLLRVGKLNVNILPFLMTIVNLIAGFIYSKGKDKKEKNFLIISSLVFLVLLYNSPSALVLYWIFNNFFSLIKNLCMKFLKNIKIKDFLPNYEHRKIFIIAIFALWMLVGLLIPSNILSASPWEFMFDDASPVSILFHSLVLSAGIFLFWGSVIYYFSNIAIKKIYVLILNLVFFLSVLHLMMYKMPSVTLTNTLFFSAYKIDFFEYDKFYLFISVFVLILFSVVLVKILFSKKNKFVENLMILTMVTCLFLSFQNVFKIFSKEKVYLQASKTNEKLKDKYINLSKNKKNVLVIFADRAIASYIPIIFNEKPELYKKYKGFTYYPNTLSSAQYTLLGYPSILGGYEYTPIEMDKRKGMFEEKFAQAITMLPAVFSLNGWSSNIVNPINEGWESETWGGVTKREIDILAQSNLYNKFKINIDSVSELISEDLKKDIKVVNSSLTKRNLLCYSFLSIMPLSLREWFYDNGLYHNPRNNTGNNYSKEFLKGYAELYNLSELTDFSSKKNTFIVFNSSLTHNPSYLKYPNYEMSLFDDVKYQAPMEGKLNPWSLRHYHTNMAFVKLLGEYFDFLRKNNTYNNTRIIIVSDHGIGYGLQNPYLTNFEMENYMPYNALLMVKDFNQNDNIKINYDFMTNAEVPYIATKNIIKTPKNPFSGKILMNKKEKSMIIKTDTNWQPVYYLGKEKILNDKNRFNYVKDNPMEEKNWKVNLKYKEALKMLEI